MEDMKKYSIYILFESSKTRDPLEYMYWLEDNIKEFLKEIG
jgi:hypothetical protein